MTEPFMSPLLLTMTPALSCAGDQPKMKQGMKDTHLEVKEDTISPPPSLALADNHHGHRCGS